MENISRLDRLETSVERKLQLLRGWWMHRRGAQAGKRFGLGRAVRILFPKYLIVGDDVTIEEYSYLHCLSAREVRFGSRTSIGRNLWLHCGGMPDNCAHGWFTIGNDSFIGCNAVIGAGGGIAIGNWVQIGQCVNMHAENHEFADPQRLIRDQGVSYKGIVIQDDVWIGSKVTILDGVTIGTGAVVGAGAVVTRSVDPYTIVAGVPARVIGMRGSQT